MRRWTKNSLVNNNMVGFFPYSCRAESGAIKHKYGLYYRINMLERQKKLFYILKHIINYVPEEIDFN